MFEPRYNAGAFLNETCNLLVRSRTICATFTATSESKKLFCNTIATLKMNKNNPNRNKIKRR